MTRARDRLTMPAGIESVLALVLMAVRGVTLVEALPGLVGSLAGARNPAPQLVLAACAGLWYVVLATLAIRLRTIRSPLLACVDVSISCLLVAGAAVLAPAHALGWTSWAATATVTSGFYAGMALHTWTARGAATVALVAAAIAPALLVAPSAPTAFDPWTRALAHPVYVVIGFVVSGHMRRLADVADSSRRRAAHAAAEAEAARHRALLHDQATILELVARGVDDPTWRGPCAGRRRRRRARWRRSWTGSARRIRPPIRPTWRGSPATSPTGSSTCDPSSPSTSPRAPSCGRPSPRPSGVP